LVALCGNVAPLISLPVPCKVIDLNDTDDTNASIERWVAMTEGAEAGEGFVYKPSPYGSERGRVWPGISAMKVRGREYLRIIYGADYTEPTFFEQLKHRRIAPKRELSVVEDQLAIGILRTFISGNKTEHLRHVAAFLATDHVRGSNIDKTL
jgi:protein phosphatase